jgi:hypothetical protein
MRWGYDAEDIPRAGSGEGVYMSHQQFFGALSVLVCLCHPLRTLCIMAN